MTIIKDYQCSQCQRITEHYVKTPPPETTTCPHCDGIAEKIITMNLTAPVDAGWINSVLEVVDKHSDKPHCKEFLNHPTRANYKNWMKGEGLRPLEPGEKRAKPNKQARKERIKHQLKMKQREREAVSI